MISSNVSERYNETLSLDRLTKADKRMSDKGKAVAEPAALGLFGLAMATFVLGLVSFTHQRGLC